MLRSFDGTSPDVAESAVVDAQATVIGDVRIDADASVWPGAVLRGDSGRIVVREGANVQDNSTFHEGADIGPYATVGHNAVVHNATVRERAMIGMGAVVLDRSEIGAESLVGANSLVTEETTVPASVLVAGTPAEVVKDVENSPWTEAGDHYVELAKRHEETGRILDGDRRR